MATMQLCVPLALAGDGHTLLSFDDLCLSFYELALLRQGFCQQRKPEGPHSAGPSRWKSLAQADDRVKSFARQKQGRPAQHLRIQEHWEPMLRGHGFPRGEP